MQETGVSYCIRGENDLLLFTLFSLKSGVTAEINPPYIKPVLFMRLLFCQKMPLPRSIVILLKQQLWRIHSKVI